MVEQPADLDLHREPVRASSARSRGRQADAEGVALLDAAIAISTQRLARPSQRMQCVSRAGPRRICVTFSPSPTPISRSESGISSPSKASSQCPPCSSGPMIGMRRRMRQPGCRGGTGRRSALARVVGGARDEDEVLASPAPVMNHLRPVMRQRSPTRSARCRSSPGRSRRHRARSWRRRSAPRPAHDGPASAPSAPRCRDAGEHHHVAVVGRGGVEHHRAEDRAVHLLVAGGHADAGRPWPPASSTVGA
jgi:hypothetical protein